MELDIDKVAADMKIVSDRIRNNKDGGLVVDVEYLCDLVDSLNNQLERVECNCSIIPAYMRDQS